MKVFEVTCEYCQNDSKEMITELQYVTSADDTLLSVTEFFTKKCDEFGANLIGVRELLTIVQHIRS